MQVPHNLAVNSITIGCSPKATGALQQMQLVTLTRCGLPPTAVPTGTPRWPKKAVAKDYFLRALISAQRKPQYQLDLARATDITVKQAGA